VVYIYGISNIFNILIIRTGIIILKVDQSAH